ncbi:MAG: hypothetical protein WKF31_07505 [Thermoleophilaceae bacterium]
MRTTVTLEPDVEALVRALMREHGLSFKQAINRAIRDGDSAEGGRQPVRTPTYRMGFDPAVRWDKALQPCRRARGRRASVRRLATGK